MDNILLYNLDQGTKTPLHHRLFEIKHDISSVAALKMKCDDTEALMVSL